MIQSKITKVRKRDGQLVDFDSSKIQDAIFKALTATGKGNGERAEELSDKVVKVLGERFQQKVPSVEDIQDVIEEVLIKEGLTETVRAYIIYREQRRRIREAEKAEEEAVGMVDQYLKKIDWEVNENANMAYSLQGLNNYVSSSIIKKYWLSRIYPKEIKEAALNGDFHIHDLQSLSVYCVGWDLYDLLLKGFGGVEGKIESKPPRHFQTALGQLVNFFYTLQGEAAGAVAISSFDTLLAPFIRYDRLSYSQVKQALQEFLFNCSVPTRVGFQTPFTNLTLDINPSPSIANQPVIIGGKPQEDTYGDFQEEMNVLNKAFYELMMEGDAKGRPFTFPIPTINITPNFSWDEPSLIPMWQATAKYGVNYFANFIHSDMKPEDTRSMCIHPKEEILIKNSGHIKRKSIGDVVDIYKKSEFDQDGWAECKAEKNLKALSLNYDTGKTEWAKVIRFLRVKDDRLVTITTEEGKKIRVSDKHLIPVLNLRGLVNKFAKDVKNGDYLLTLKKASALNGHEYQKLSDRLVLNEDLAKILGYFIADGNYLFENRKNLRTFGQPRGLQFTFNAQTKENLNIIKKLIKKVFHLETKEKKDPRYNSYYLYVYNTKIARDLWNAGFKKYGRLPNVLFNSPIKVIEKFLLYHFKGDGYDKRKEIHINDKELARDLVILYSLVGWPVTYRERQSSQVIYIQHSKSKVRKDGILSTPLFSQRVPGFLAKSTFLVPGLVKSRMVGFNALDKYNAFTLPSRKIKDSDYYITRVKEVKIKTLSQPQTFFDLELEKNHLFVHSLGTITHNCCRLRLDNRELYKRGGGLFGSQPLTGSIGVVTIDVPRIGYLSKTKKEFFERLAKMMDLARESLEIKRKTLERFTKKGLYPYSKYWLANIKKMRGQYWGNHFSTIGLIGMNEASLNFMGENIGSEKGKHFAEEVLDFMRKRLVSYQEETGNLYNLEASPAEGTSYRLAKMDKEKYPDIITAGKEEPYYTNSTQLPVNYTTDVFEALKLQDKIQTKYTGGTILHLFLGEQISDIQTAKNLVKKVFENFELPYITITPTFCYDSQTEVLTKSGWKLIKDVKTGEEIMTANPETRELSYEKVVRKFEYDYKGKMIHFKARRKGFDCLVTPNHRMFIEPKAIRVRDSKGKFKTPEKYKYFERAEEVKFNTRVPLGGFIWKGRRKEFFILPPCSNNKKSMFKDLIKKDIKNGLTNKEISAKRNCSPSLVSMIRHNKRGSVEDFKEIKIPMDTWLKFFGIWLAEGNARVRPEEGGGEAYIAQRDEKIRKEIENVLKKLPFRYTKEKRGFHIYSLQLASYLSQFSGSRKKYVPTELKQLSKDQLKILINWHFKGDGTKGTNYSASFSPRLRDDLQELYLKIGYHASVRKYNVTKRITKHAYIGYYKKEVNYDGKIYDIEVERNHVIYVRRNGFPVFSSNSVCPVHGYLSGEHFYCPKCTVKQPCEVYSRVVGYLRPIKQWNAGKQEEFKQRREFKSSKEVKVK